MLSLNAMNDPAVGRREDFVRPQGRGALDYRYQKVPAQDRPLAQTPVIAQSKPGLDMRRAMAGVGDNLSAK